MLTRNGPSSNGRDISSVGHRSAIPRPCVIPSRPSTNISRSSSSGHSSFSDDIGNEENNSPSNTNSTISQPSVTAFARLMTSLREIRNGQKQQDLRMIRIEQANCGTTVAQSPETFDIPLPIKKIEQFDLLEKAVEKPETRMKFVSLFKCK